MGNIIYQDSGKQLLQNIMKTENKLIITILLVALSTGTFAGCTSFTAANGRPASMVEVSDVSIREAPTSAEPEKAIEEIYASIPDYDYEENAEQLNEKDFEDKTGIKASKVIEQFSYQSNPKAGLADIVIIRPYNNTRDEVREFLYQYKDRRASEFENYDIMDSFSIAQNAVIYDQGNYLIMLMLADNESAQDIIDQYIPL